ncbi:hypothetical protein SOPP22_18305 [Shewanella sp. OPT22]|nr:hypothetical protein SOPP22_18305 [Shewanella sp. OPT22]
MSCSYEKVKARLFEVGALHAIDYSEDAYTYEFCLDDEKKYLITITPDRLCNVKRNYNSKSRCDWLRTFVA